PRRSAASGKLGVITVARGTSTARKAADLLGEAEATDIDAMHLQGEALLSLGPKAVLLKGGHLNSGDAVDLVLSADGTAELTSPRTATRNTHGTGCTLSSALATQLGLGHSLTEAAERAKAYISKAIATADELDVGQGHGPVNHFHRS
ncbi:MAG: bifunctional hydroxymethylpyrimidine kinase/phosphomethylpyrimidine kinase, partial [Pseudomonadota bacterium]